MSRSAEMMKPLALSALLLAAPALTALAEETPAPSREGGFGLGRTALPEEIAAWDWDVRPDGQGLPVGEGDVWTGEELFVDLCSACHGDFGEAVGRWPVLAGGFGTLDGHDPVKTIGSYWPYLSTVVDYVHRAMPYGNAESLSADETYAIVAYLLYVNDLVDDDFVLSNESFFDVEMPNAGAFYMDDRPETELALFSEEPCMTDCGDAREITMRAAVLDVTPDTDAGEEAAAEVVEEAAAPAPEEAPAEEVAAAEDILDPDLVAAGAGVFRQCQACHQVGPGAQNRVGPALNGVYGAVVGTHEGFRYSPVLVEAGEGGMVWDDANLAAYLADPRGFLPRNRMAFQGLRNAEDIAAVIAYIRSESAE